MADRAVHNVMQIFHQFVRVHLLIDKRERERDRDRKSESCAI